MKKKLLMLFCLTGICISLSAQYVPSEENLKARQEFDGFRFGIFLHWGIYSEFAQGEWYLNSGKLQQEEYAKSASCFYPIRFDAREWVRAIKESGARYITFTSRHHDGFSMFHTAENKYNIVDATPFKRDVLKELADACHEQGVKLHLYYSILDWMREDYPLGRTGLFTGRESANNWNGRPATEKARINKEKYPSYFQFMKNQVRELLMNYKDIGALWFDGYWDHDSDSIPFDWRMSEFYDYIHTLKPECLVGNNHHITPIDGEDFQMFERDLPGENKAGFSENQTISALPLEMCQTMNGMWGYKVADQNYKTTEQLIELLVRAAAKGSNLLMNIGPQPNGELPATALNRLKGMGKWLNAYGETIYGTHRYDAEEPSWGVVTQKDSRLFLHILHEETKSITLPIDKKPKTVVVFDSKQPLGYTFNKKKKELTVQMPASYTAQPDFIIQINRQ
ncbi:MAG: alpha-L-fucosidase [Prevotella sp.]|nr:alpha-L-fucosidase [Prevotella sp.]